MELISQFHFIHPLWLWLWLPAGLIMWSVYHRSDSLRAWRKVISPQLLKHLLLEDEKKSGRWRPVYMLGIAWLVGIFALAGPSWKASPSPFIEDQAGLFIVLKVTADMLAEDIQPSRLQRSVIKIHDLLELKNDLRTGLVAYAGSSHLVMPLTTDQAIINSFAAALDPGIMPQTGDDPAAAISLAGQRLKKAGIPGSIVLITDAIDPSQHAALKKAQQANGIAVHILAVAADASVIPPLNSPPAAPLNLKLMQQAANALDGSLTTVSADKGDIQQLASRIERSINAAPQGEGEQWQDAGYYLLPLLALIMLTFFRRGGAVVVG